MTPPVASAYEDAIDLLDADHKAVKKMFIDYDALCEDGAGAPLKAALAARICRALRIHTQIEEEIFYPAVRKSIHDNHLMNDAMEEHAEAKQVISNLEKMSTVDAKFDAAVKELATMIDAHVLEEREQMFPRAKLSTLDLRGLAVPLFERQQQLKQEAVETVREAA